MADDLRRRMIFIVRPQRQIFFAGNAVRRQQRSRPAGVLRRHQRHLPQSRQRPQRNVLQIADGRGN